jgi:photosystem II stability/assembly factor-like uncharacterized protein
MKPILLLAAIGLFIWVGVAGVALFAQSTVGQGRDFRSGNLVSMSFVDADHGWSVAADCTAPMASSSVCRSVIYGTSDGGRTWSSLSQVLLTPRRIDFASRDVGWLVGSIGQQCGTTLCQNVIMLTSNGGKKWDRVSTVSAALSDVAAVSADDFWAVGEACPRVDQCSGVLVHTTSGGQLWDNSTLPIVGNDLRTGRLSPLVGWVARADGGTSLQSLAITRDGGQTWTWVATPCGERGLLVDFASVDDGWLVCAQADRPSNNQVTVARTADGGTTWHSVAEISMGEPLLGPANPTPTVAVSDAVPRALRAVPVGNAWVALETGQLIQTAEPPGQTELRIDEKPVDVRFVDARHGWILGQSTVWLTTDGGKTWTASRVVPINRGG